MHLKQMTNTHQNGKQPIMSTPLYQTPSSDNRRRLHIPTTIYHTISSQVVVHSPSYRPSGRLYNWSTYVYSNLLDVPVMLNIKELDIVCSTLQWWS